MPRANYAGATGDDPPSTSDQATSRRRGGRRVAAPVAALLDARELGYAISLAPNLNVFAVDKLSSFLSGFMIVCALKDLWRS